MKLPLSWLRDYVDVDLPVPELARRLIDATAEVEGWETIGGAWDRALVLAAEIVAVDPHPDADRLSLVTVDLGGERQQVVTGAPNVRVGQKVAFAKEGATLVDGHTGKPATLKLRPIRGVMSGGMVLSEKELGLGEGHEGILDLPARVTPGRPLVDEIGDVVFDITTWANRADLLGVLGLAREVAAITDRPLREPPLTYAESARPVEELVSVAVEAPDLCRRFTASVVENVTVGPSPQWLQDRLQRMGMRPINNVVDITNYVMLETGQPLHAFDYDLVRGHRIVARRAKPGERLTTLDGVDRELDPEMLVICDGEGPVGIAGVMGGGNSEVSESTTTVVLEVANFKGGSIRRTSTLLRLRSEASLRFEKGLGPDLADYARRRALHLFEALTGGSVAKGAVDVYPGQAPRRTIVVPAARIERVLGIDIPPLDVRRVLVGLGFGCHHVPPDRFSVQPPFWRPDVEIADDVIEDLIRVYGYDRLPTTSLRGSLPEREPDPVMDVRERVRDLAVALGFQEVINYTLTGMRTLERVVDPADTRRMSPLGVLNPVAAQHTYLRTSLRGSVLQSYALNRPQHEGPLRLFELAFEYLPAEDNLPHERPVLCALLGGPRETRWGRPGSERLDFYDAKGALEALGASLGVPLTFAPATQHGLLPGHTAGVRSGKEHVGVVAQVHPATATAFDIDEPVFLVELWIEELTRCVPDRPAYEPPARFPEARNDVALLLDCDMPAGKIVALARSHRSGGIRTWADVFDEYRGPGVPEGKKSLALRLRYFDPARTLTDEDVAKAQGALLKRLERECGATLRGS